MTSEELREMIGDIVEQKLLQLLGDPDSGLQLRDALRKRLERQQKAVASGNRGMALDDVIVQLGLE